MSEIAIFGGTFDPPTLAHEAIIRSCLDRSDMDQVWVMPSGQRLDKPDMMNNQQRLEMLHIVAEDSFANNGKLHISEFEMDLPQPTQTIDTLKELKVRYADDRFWFVFGADSYRNMHTWEGGNYLKRSLGMLVVDRAGEQMPEQEDNIRHLSVANITDFPISSSQVREALRLNQPIDKFVSRSIAKYLIRSGCYV